MRAVRFFLFALPLALPLALGETACSSGSATACRFGAECASGVCRSDGTCATDDPPPPPPGDAGAQEDVATADAGPLPGCVANKDGLILAAEVPLKAGLRATFRATSNVAVDTKGVVQGDGSRAWDLSGALAGDHARVVETLDPKGAWWAPSFANATYSSRLTESSDLLGVFEVGGSALTLRGVVSPMDGFTKTNVAHNGPASILQFPLKEGASWTTTSNVQGVASGVATFYTEQYASQVDARGTLKTPFGTFDVLRVRTVLTRTVGVLPTVTRTFTFVTECYGTVATIASQPNELAVEFTQAAEVSRLAP